MNGVVCVFIFFFFFQAEDGIRDLTVTGVQTCALPISGSSQAPKRKIPASFFLVPSRSATHGWRIASRSARYRSEEHTSELQSQSNLVCRLLLEKKKKTEKPCLHSRGTHEHRHHRAGNT